MNIESIFKSIAAIATAYFGYKILMAVMSLLI